MSQVEAANPEAVVRSGADIGDRATALAAQIDQQQATIDKLRSGWSGTSADAAIASATASLQRMQRLHDALTGLQSPLQDGGTDLVQQRSRIVSTVDQLRGQGWQVADDGTVSIRPGSVLDAFARLSPLNRMMLQALAAKASLELKTLLAQFETTDNKVGQQIRAAAAALSGPAAKESPAPTGPKALVDRLAGMTPDERAAFLAELSPETVHEMVLADPQVMGNTDGVPFDTRIEANNINIRNALAEELQKQPPDDVRVKQLQAMLTPIKDPNDSGTMVPRKFVAFSTEGNGRMIEMIGEIKPGIKGVGVVVPGTNTNLNGSGSNHESAVQLAAQSDSPIFLYMGDDFPQGLDKAADPSYAASMAPKLVSFGHEIDRAVGQGAPGTPVTYIGHSYGGAIVGTAEQMGLRADRVLHASSAGTGILTGEYTNPNPNVQRYSMTAPGDPIALVQSLPRDVSLSNIPGVDSIPGIPHNVDGRIGNPLGGLPSATDPDNIPGVTRLDTGYYGREGEHANQPIVGPDGHGKYWDDYESDAFRNMVAVIQGGEANGYVERGIQTDYVDINVGDDGNFGAEAADQGRAAAGPKIPELPWDNGGSYDRRQHPWDNPVVTDNPGSGPRVQVK
ncbi:WXG100 family type VII secretion target [Mycolicibacterium frederiksbergense]|uniref:WXG100 family type VII secretion target n=1 Tax=Mycolicibacterium frederiksbergense TaxID=117567 RepID=UPI00355634EA